VNAKQVIVIRKDLGMRRGKEIAQGAHASIAWLTERLAHPAGTEPNFHCVWLSDAQLAWVTGSFTKVTCQVSSQEELEAVYERARELGTEAHMVTDAGRTEFGGVPTVTAVAVGPDWEDRVDVVTGELRLY
jgi:PTH2 family peptidyl-tRNA hydrolase